VEHHAVNVANPLQARPLDPCEHAVGRRATVDDHAALGLPQSAVPCRPKPRVYQPVLERLAGDSRELLRLTPTRHGRLVWIEGAPGRAPGLMSPPAMTGSVALHANGKAWQATLAEADVLRLQRDFGLAAPRPVGRTSVVGR
jgi:DNA-binding IclR family transcriptional regulator